MRMGELHARGEKIDRVTLANELLRHGELESCDGISYLVSLDDGLPQIYNLDSYFRIVKDKSILRRIIFTSQNLIEPRDGGRGRSGPDPGGRRRDAAQAGRIAREDRPGHPAPGHRRLRGRRQCLPRSQPARQGHQHRLHEVRRDDRRPASAANWSFWRLVRRWARRRSRSTWRSTWPRKLHKTVAVFLARNVAGIAAHPHAVRLGARGQPPVPRRLSATGRAQPPHQGAERAGAGAHLHRRHGRRAPDGDARQAAPPEVGDANWAWWWWTTCS